jgi:hypothetical protein
MAVLTNWQGISDIVVLKRGTDVAARPRAGRRWSSSTHDPTITVSPGSYGYGPLNFYLEAIGVRQPQQLQQVIDLAIDQWKQKVSPLS